jgi:hypothetical protein
MKQQNCQEGIGTLNEAPETFQMQLWQRLETKPPTTLEKAQE